MLKLLFVKYSTVFFKKKCRLHLVVYRLQDILMMFDDDKVKSWIIK